MEVPLIHTDRCVMRPVDYAESFAMTELANDFDVWINLRDYFPHPYTHDHALDFIHHSQALKYPCNFSIFLGHQFCGIIGIIPGEDVHRHTAEIGYWLGKPFWQSGIASECLPAFSEWIFHNYAFSKLYASVFDYNLASMKVLVKSGFQEEAILLQNVLKNGKLVNEHRFCKFRVQYPK